MPLNASLDEYADPGWLTTKSLLIDLGNLGIRIVLNEYLLEGIPNTYVLTPDNYNSGLSMVRRVCSDLSGNEQVMIVGPLLVTEEINPPTFGPWRDMLRWERMRGYVDGVKSYVQMFIRSLDMRMDMCIDMHARMPEHTQALGSRKSMPVPTQH